MVVPPSTSTSKFSGRLVAGRKHPTYRRPFQNNNRRYTILKLFQLYYIVRPLDDKSLASPFRLNHAAVIRHRQINGVSVFYYWYNTTLIVHSSTTSSNSNSSNTSTTTTTTIVVVLPQEIQ